jgi:hypothetical protein
MDSGEPNSHCLALYQPQQPSPGVLSPNQNILNIEKPTKPKQKPQQKNLLVWPSLAAKYDNPKKQSSSSTSSNVPGDSNSSSTTTSTFRKRKAGDEGSSVSGDSKKTKVQSGQEDEKAKKSKQETESTSTTPLRQQVCCFRLNYHLLKLNYLGNSRVLLYLIVFIEHKEQRAMPLSGRARTR